MERVNPQLREYVEREILTRYDGFDAAHRRNHVDKVINQSMAFANYYDVDPNMVYTIAAYHDTGLCRGREQHHTESKRILNEDKVLREWFTKEQIAIMGDAVEDHRASSKSAPRTIYGRIVSEADRIIIPEEIVRRTIQFTINHYPTHGKEEGYERMLEHLHEKYDYGGYLRLWIKESENAHRLEELRQLIANKEALRQLFERIYAEEIDKNNLTK